MSKVTKKDKKQPVALPAGNHKINDRAMLVGLSIRRWHPHKTDKTISEEVATKHNSESNMGRYRKRLVSRDYFRDMLTVINKLKSKHEYLTLPWADDGYRILSGVGYLEYTKQLRALIAEFDHTVADFLPKYAEMQADMKKRQGSIYNADDYPSKEELKLKFGITITVRPVPSGDDFRVDVGDQEAKNIRAAIEAETKTTVEMAMKDVWSRLAKVIQHASERLKLYEVDEEGKTAHTFRDSLITNITELLDVVPLLNVTGDVNLTEFADRIKTEIAVHTPEQLRDTETLRVSVAEKADDILKKMAGFLA